MSKTIHILSHEYVTDFIQRQLSCWSLAKSNYDAIVKAKRRSIKIGDLECGIQWNPARIVSTGAKVDSEAVKNRSCFLCRGNRPSEQMIYPILGGWDMLVNPYPIFPVHLTIAATNHVPQDKVPEDIVKVTGILPGMTVFFNGAHAGASAPDHLHMQAVLKDEIPLIKLVEKIHSTDNPGIIPSYSFDLNLPFFFLSGIVENNETGLKTLIAGLKAGGLSSEGILNDPSLVNTFFWMDSTNMLRFISIPRRLHRPSCYYAEGEKNRMVSPGCIDMGGIIITPREIDFNQLTKKEIETIYSEVALSNNSFI